MANNAAADAGFIRWLQQKLNEQGFNLRVDGIAGKNTREAIRAFQERSGIPVNSMATQATVEALRKGPMRPPTPGLRADIDQLNPVAAPGGGMPNPNMRPPPDQLNAVPAPPGGGVPNPNMRPPMPMPPPGAMPVPPRAPMPPVGPMPGPTAAPPPQAPVAPPMAAPAAPAAPGGGLPAELQANIAKLKAAGASDEYLKVYVQTFMEQNGMSGPNFGAATAPPAPIPGNPGLPAATQDAAARERAKMMIMQQLLQQRLPAAPSQ